MKRREALCVYGENVDEANQFFSCWLTEDPTRKLIVFNERVPLQKVAWEHLLFDLKLAFLPSTSKKQRQVGEKLFEEFKFLQMGAEALLGDVRDQGKTVTQNLLRNLSFLNGAYKASAFANSFEGIPAIICGAGPSLHRHLPFLNLAKEKGLLLAGGSAVKALYEQGIRPHAMAYLDPQPPAQLFSKESLEELPLFFPLRVATEVLQSAQGPKIWAADGISYPIETWLTKQLDIEEPSIEGGWNVVTFCISLCAMMGCNPIVLVGVDLLLPEGESYTKGIAHTYKKEELIETKQGLTKKDFLLAADWIESFAEEHPEISIINVAKEAWKIPGVKTKPFEKILKKLSEREIRFDFASPLHCKSEHALKSWEENKSKANTMILSKISMLEKHFPVDPRDSGEYALLEVEFEELPIYQLFLKPIWEVWRNLFEQQTPVDEPYPGFGVTVQKWLFFQEVLNESV
jgi:hypothetical protein